MHCAVAAPLDGTWVPVAADVSGHPLAVAQLRVARLVIEHDRYRIVDHAEQVADSGELQVDPAAFPCALDLIGMHAPHAGKRMLAIIERAGNRLCICYDLEHCERPRSLRPVADQLLLSITYVRAAAH